MVCKKRNCFAFTTILSFTFRLEAETLVLRRHTIEFPDRPTHYAAEVLVKIIPDNQEVIVMYFYFSCQKRNTIKYYLRCRSHIYTVCVIMMIYYFG